MGSVLHLKSQLLSPLKSGLAQLLFIAINAEFTLVDWFKHVSVHVRNRNVLSFTLFSCFTFEKVNVTDREGTYCKMLRWQEVTLCDIFFQILSISVVYFTGGYAGWEVDYGPKCRQQGHNSHCQWYGDLVQIHSSMLSIVHARMTLQENCWEHILKLMPQIQKTIMFSLAWKWILNSKKVNILSDGKMALTVFLVVLCAVTMYIIPQMMNCKGHRNKRRIADRKAK